MQAQAAAQQNNANANAGPGGPAGPGGAGPPQSQLQHIISQQAAQAQAGRMQQMQQALLNQQQSGAGIPQQQPGGPGQVSFYKISKIFLFYCASL